MSEILFARSGRAVCLKQLSRYYYLFKSRAENGVELDQLASEKPADLDRHHFQNKDISE